MSICRFYQNGKKFREKGLTDGHFCDIPICEVNDQWSFF